MFTKTQWDVFHNSSLDGHLISGDNLMYVSSQVVNTLEAVDVDTPNLYPRSHGGKFSLSLIIVNKNCLNFDNEVLAQEMK